MSDAFTLAEVLITLVIIGVIAAITIPSVVANYQERERIAKVKKCYSVLSQAMIRVLADGGDMIFEVKDADNANIKLWFDTYLKQYLITTKICYNTAGCWNNEDTKYLNGNNSKWNRKGIGVGYDIITAVLNDGSLIDIDAFSSSDIKNSFKINTKSSGLVVYFDINGARKPNTIGKDIFVTVFTEDGLVPAYKNGTSVQIDSDCSKSGTGISCIQKYLYEN